MQKDQLKISIVIITKNEAQNIRRCLDSVKWADEIVVLDSGSVDQTLEICREFNCRIVQSEWLGFGKTKQKAVEAASNDWIFSIDADEEMTAELKQKLSALLAREPESRGYRIKRKSFYLGKLIRYSGWHRDYQLRFFNRRIGRFNDKNVHESVQLKEKAGVIDAPLLHHTYPTISSHLQKMDRYSGLGADALHQKGKSVTIGGSVFRGIIKFLRMYILHGGFLDGRTGFILALNSAYGVYLKYIKLWQLNR